MTGTATLNDAVDQLAVRDDRLNPDELVLAIKRLKDRLCAGLSMEDALANIDDMLPADRRAVALWFEMDF